jgi:Domain of unknown function (DUF4834)
MIFVQNRQVGGGLLSQLGCLFFAILFFVGLFYASSWLYQKLWVAAPFLTLAAVVINWRIPASTGRWWILMFRNSPIMAILFGVVLFFLFPILSVYWLLGAIGSRLAERYLRRMQTRFGEQFGQQFRFGQDDRNASFWGESERPYNQPPVAPRQSSKRDDDDQYVDFEEVK